MIERYENQQHTILHGDAISILSNHIPSESVDLIFLDPPYNIGKKFSNFHDKWDSEEEYVNWSYQWLDECIRILKPHGTIYVMTSTQAMPYFDIYLRKKLTILGRIIWHYDSSGVQATKYFGSMYEPILYCVKDKNNYTFNADDIKIEAKTGSQRKLIDYRKSVPTPYNTEKVPGNAWYFPRVRYRMEEYENHPSQKPESLLERIILASSNEGSVILDPFAGTFTTGAVAKRLGRRSISIELQEEYLKIGLRRVLGIHEYKGEKLLLPQKDHNIKNKNGKKLDLDLEFIQGSIFDANTTA
ncbi:adenine-specific DNA-methyltransferase [Dolichospermum sp. ST_con]|nr:adenine-specific DNA-methyltransferase [Dolichospermum sp. ST_con]MDD1419581.1 adenine-specific DNA-methyltransferase [Dolichospermum sp. ST_sed1]MDD1428635.1 adenine-specific DNA-methyltransferase [Dolichospermum sp. ST_sed9]MDD1431302.1 adenine-specific DNA-methyltransferase [Dolichospermum sp. ST_sed6]MDD1437329.1 adenine-specific DNA-methyltransferase [Dolichospermum sp. ST_sed10]MDD1440048.1 adenine-specific DNA-methyltransferase [Dolichospermum sp. ST_sed3]MDD1444625.1 adenine-specif